jgi:antitoxin component of MazEF toxin-antitoxin module
VTADQLLSMVQTNAVLKKLLGNALAYNTIPNQVIGQFQFADGQKVTTAHQGKQLTATKNADGVFLTGDMNNKGTPAKIVNGNIKTKAGVAHGVNAVLLPFNLPRLGPKP